MRHNSERRGRIMLVKVDSRGRITVPKAVLRNTKITPGDKVTFRVTASGGIFMDNEERKSEAQKAEVSRRLSARTSCT
jgi:AbrB family looped-hinge helix DNA binding protein